MAGNRAPLGYRRLSLERTRRGGSLSPNDVAQITAKMEAIYGLPLEEIESAWQQYWCRGGRCGGGRRIRRVAPFRLGGTAQSP